MATHLNVQKLMLDDLTNYLPAVLGKNSVSVQYVITGYKCT